MNLVKKTLHIENQIQRCKEQSLGSPRGAQVTAQGHRCQHRDLSEDSVIQSQSQFRGRHSIAAAKDCR